MEDFILWLLAMLLKVCLAVAKAMIEKYGLEWVWKWIKEFMADMGF